MGRVRDLAKEAYWRRLLERHRRNGLPVVRYFESVGVPVHQFYWWRREVLRRDQQAAASESGGAVSHRSRSGGGQQSTTRARRVTTQAGRGVMQLHGSSAARSVAAPARKVTPHADPQDHDVELGRGIAPRRLAGVAGNRRRSEQVPSPFVPVRLPSLMNAPLRPDAPIEIAHPSGCVVRVAAGLDAALLRRILTVLDSKSMNTTEP